MQPPSASLPSFPSLIFLPLPNVSTQTGQSIWQPACAAPWSFCKSLTSGARVIIKAAAAVVLWLSITFCCGGSQLLLWHELRCAWRMWWNVRKMDVKQADKQVSFTLWVIKTSRLFISWIIKTRKSWRKYLEWSRRAFFIKLSSKSKRTQVVTKSFCFFFPPQSSQSGLGWWIHPAKWTPSRITFSVFFGFGFDFLS